MKYYQKIFTLSVLLSLPFLSYASYAAQAFCPRMVYCNEDGTVCTDEFGNRPIPWNFNSFGVMPHHKKWSFLTASQPERAVPRCFYTAQDVVLINSMGGTMDWVPDMTSPGNVWQIQDGFPQCHEYNMQCPFKPKGTL